MNNKSKTDLSEGNVELPQPKSETLHDTFFKNFSGIAYRAYLKDATPVHFIGNVEGITGYTRDEFIKGSVKWDELILQEDMIDIGESWGKLSTVAGYSTEREYRIKRKDGGTVWLCDICSNITDDSGKPIFIDGTLLDITKRKQAELTLQDSELMFRGLFDNSPDGILIGHNETMRFQFANPAMCKMMGYTQDEFKTISVQDIHPQLDLPWIIEALKEISAGGLGSLENVPLLRKDGSIIYCDVSSCWIPINKKDHLVAFFRDITMKTQVQQSIRNASDREQERFGHDLHDGLGQNLTGVAYLCKSIEDKLINDGNKAAVDVGKVRELISECIKTTKEIAEGIQPVKTEEGGLPAALKRLSHQINETFNLPCDLEIDNDCKPMTESNAVDLYRIAQEAVSNAMRHGSPKRMSLRLFRENNQGILSIADDGKGMDGIEVKSKAGIGLDTMQSRAAVIHGHLKIESTASSGTCVICRFPLGEQQSTSSKE